MSTALASIGDVGENASCWAVSCSHGAGASPGRLGGRPVVVGRATTTPPSVRRPSSLRRRRRRRPLAARRRTRWRGDRRRADGRLGRDAIAALEPLAAGSTEPIARGRGPGGRSRRRRRSAPRRRAPAPARCRSRHGAVSRSVAARRRATRAARRRLDLAAERCEVGLDRGPHALAVSAAYALERVGVGAQLLAARRRGRGSRPRAGDARPRRCGARWPRLRSTSACALASDSSSSWRGSRLRLVHRVVGGALREQQRALQHLGVVAARREWHLGRRARLRGARPARRAPAAAG